MTPVIDNTTSMLQTSISSTEARFYYKNRTENKLKNQLSESWKGGTPYSASPIEPRKQLSPSLFSTSFHEDKSISTSSPKSHPPSASLALFHSMLVTQSEDIGHSTMQRIVENAYKRTLMQGTDPPFRRLLVAPKDGTSPITSWEPSMHPNVWDNAPQKAVAKNEVFLKKLLFFWQKKPKPQRHPTSADWALPKYTPNAAKPTKARRKFSRKAAGSPLALGFTTLGPSLHSDLKTILEQEKLIQREKMKRKKLLETLRRLKVGSPGAKQELGGASPPFKTLPMSSMKGLDTNLGSSLNKSRRKKALVPLADSEKEALEATVSKPTSPWRSVERPFIPSARPFSTSSRSTTGKPATPNGYEWMLLASRPTSSAMQRSALKVDNVSHEEMPKALAVHPASRGRHNSSIRGHPASSGVGTSSKPWTWKERTQAYEVPVMKRPVQKKTFAAIRKTHPKTTNVHTCWYQAQHQRLLELERATGVPIDRLERALAIPDDVLKPWVVAKKKIKHVTRVETQTPTLRIPLVVQPKLAPPKRKKWTRPWIAPSRRGQEIKVEKPPTKPTTRNLTSCTAITKKMRPDPMVPMKLNIARVCSKDGMVEMEPYSIYWLDHLRSGIVRKKEKRQI